MSDVAAPRYRFTIEIKDHTDSHTFNVLDSAGEVIFGMKAANFYDIHKDKERVNSLIREKQFPKKLDLLIMAELDNNKEKSEDQKSTVIFPSSTKSNDYSIGLLMQAGVDAAYL